MGLFANYFTILSCGILSLDLRKHMLRFGDANHDAAHVVSPFNFYVIERVNQFDEKFFHT